jgi:transcriptional regulator of acetoin/glycerol metabolism
VVPHSCRPNVRELQNITERAVALAEGDTVTLADLPPDLQNLAPTNNGPWPTLKAQEREYSQKVQTFTNHQTGESARILNLPRTTL